MSWNKVIDRAKQETFYRLGKGGGNGHANSGVVTLNIIMLVNDDGVPLIWTIESKRIEPGAQARELLESLLLT